MNIMELGAIGELVGGVAVIGSLLYVGLQIRQNSTWLRANVVDGASHQMANNHLFLAAVDNSSLVGAFAADPGTLDAGLAGRLSQVFMAVTRVQETAHFHFLQGHYPPEIWAGYRGHLELLAESPFFDPWWEVRKPLFSETFRRYVDDVRAHRGKFDIAQALNPVEG